MNLHSAKYPKYHQKLLCKSRGLTGTTYCIRRIRQIPLKFLVNNVLSSDLKSIKDEIRLFCQEKREKVTMVDEIKEDLRRVQKLMNNEREFREAIG